MKTLALLLFAASTAAAAETYVIDGTHTTPMFEIRHMNMSKQRGFFTETMGIIKLDRATKTGSIDVVVSTASIVTSSRILTDVLKRSDWFDVDLASIDLASEESEAEVRKEEWFDTTRFPVATFRSSSVRALGSDRYEVTGKLAMKGATRDLVVPVEVRSDAAGNTVAEARFAVKRLPYRIGDGPWSDPSVVADDIAVRARIVLSPQ